MWLIFVAGLKDIRNAQVQAATDRLTWAQSPTFLAGLTASILVADVLDDPEGNTSIFTYALCYISLLTATLSATLSALAAVYMQQQRYLPPVILQLNSDSHKQEVPQPREKHRNFRHGHILC